MSEHSSGNVPALRIFLRVYGVLSLLIFVPLLVGFVFRSPLLAESGGVLNWLIWNDVHAGDEHAHVPPMLFVIYITWAVFLLVAANRQPAYASFLHFTMWANLGHGLLMAVQAATDLDRYWSKFLTDIPFILIVAVAIYLWRPSARARQAVRA